MPEPVAPLIATSDGAFLLGGGISGSVVSLSSSSGDVIRSIAVHSSPVSSLHLTDDGSLLISGSEVVHIYLLFLSLFIVQFF